LHSLTLFKQPRLEASAIVEMVTHWKSLRRLVLFQCSMVSDRMLELMSQHVHLWSKSLRALILDGNDHGLITAPMVSAWISALPNDPTDSGCVVRILSLRYFSRLLASFGVRLSLKRLAYQHHVDLYF
jgi:hypothetical protein